MTTPTATKTVSAPDLRGGVCRRDAVTKCWVCWFGQGSGSLEEIALEPSASVSRLIQQARAVVDVQGRMPSELRCALRPPGAPATRDADAALPLLSKRETLDALDVADGSVFVLMPERPVVTPLEAKISNLRRVFTTALVERSGGFHLHNPMADRRHRSMFDLRHYVPVGLDKFAALLDPSLKIVAVTGPAGSGKTAFAEETVPRALMGCGFVEHPVIVCSLLATRGASERGHGLNLQQGFRAVFEKRMDSSCLFDEMTVPAEHRFGTAVGVVDEVPTEPVHLQELFEEFEAATPWAKVRLLVVAGTSLSHHPGLPPSNTAEGGVAKVRLSPWQKEEVVQLVGNVADSQAPKQSSSDKEAVRFLARLVLGMTPSFVSGEEDTSAVAALLRNRQCANLEHLMRHNARACRLVADMLLYLAPFLTSQLKRISPEDCVSFQLEPSTTRTPEQIAAAVERVSDLPSVEFIRHYLSVLENNAPTIIATTVTRLFKFSAVSEASKNTLRGVAKAILAVVNKDQRVACQGDWQSFRASHSGGQNCADLAVSYGLLTLDLRPSAATPALVELKPTAVGLYIALMCLGFVLPNATTHEVFFERIAALAVVTKYHMDDILAVGAPGVRQASVEDEDFQGSTAHFDTRLDFPKNVLVFAVPRSSSSRARFNGTHMWMVSSHTANNTADKATDEAAGKTASQAVAKELAESTRPFGDVRGRMVFVCERREALNAEALNAEALLPTLLPRCGGAEVVLMCGRQLEHWWPLLRRAQLHDEPSAPQSTATAKSNRGQKTGSL